MRSTRIVAISALTLLPLGLVGCGDPQSKNSTIQTRMINGLVGVNNGHNLDLSSSHGGQFVGNLPLGGASVYTEGPYGDTTISVGETGTQNSLGSYPITLRQGVRYTIAAVGVLGGTGTRAPRIIPISDSLLTNFSSQTAPATSLRIVNLSPDGPPVEVTRQDRGTDPEVIVTGLANISYGNASPYVILPFSKQLAGEAQAPAIGLRIRNSQTGQELHLPSFNRGDTFLSGGSYTLFIVGLSNAGAGQQGLDAKTVLDN